GTQRALRLAQGIAEGLAAVHAAGLVHRDVKPSNVLLRADETPVLIDFGLVGAARHMLFSRRLTPSNLVVATAEYAAPEQIERGAIDARSDLYSLGVMLYELL